VVRSDVERCADAKNGSKVADSEKLWRGKEEGYRVKKVVGGGNGEAGGNVTVRERKK